MFPKERRIRNSKEFKRIYQRGSFFGGDLLSINFLANRLSFSRLGIVVNRKIEPKATKRNKIKRRFREAARKLYEGLPAGYDIIITIKKPAIDAEFSKIEHEVKEVFEKLGTTNTPFQKQTKIKGYHPRASRTKDNFVKEKRSK